MSHTELQQVTYYSGHVIEVNGKRYVPERTCRNIHPDVFQCSECYAIDEDWKHPPFCHGCGARVKEGECE